MRAVPNYYAATWTHSQDSRTDVIRVHFQDEVIATIPGEKVREAGIETEPGFEQRQFVFYECIDEIQSAVDALYSELDSRALDIHEKPRG